MAVGRRDRPFQSKQAKTFAEQVVVRLEIPGWRTDIEPVSIPGIGEERLPGCEQGWKELVLKRELLAGRDEAQNFRLEYVDTCVDRVAGDLVCLGLFEEAADSTIRFGLHQAVGARIVDRGKDDGRRSFTLAVKCDHRGEVQIRQDIPIEDYGRLRQVILSVLVRSGSPEGCGLD